MRVVLLGVRGSTPDPGAEFAAYGGHTSCVAVLRSGDRVPRLVLDAGTGLRDLGGLLDGAAFRGTLVLSHLHWDHVQGLPFCPPIDRSDAVVDAYVPAGAGDSAAELLSRSMSPPSFPIGPDELHGRWRFVAARPGMLPVACFGVTVAEVEHRGGLTYGVRVEADGAAFGYLPDHAPCRGSAAAEQLVAGVDVLLHDGQYLAGERAVADGYGHATIDGAVRFARRCGVRRLVLTHHAPGRTDAALDALAAGLVAEFGDFVTLARQGTTVPIAVPGAGPASGARAGN